MELPLTAFPAENMCANMMLFWWNSLCAQSHTIFLCRFFLLWNHPLCKAWNLSDAVCICSL